MSVIELLHDQGEKEYMTYLLIASTVPVPMSSQTEHLQIPKET